MTGDNSDTFQFSEQLNESRFRLLRLHRNVPGTQLRCTLEVCSLNPDNYRQHYEAISYVCGTSPNNSWIICNKKRLSIRPSLHIALQRFRHADRDRVLWADQICINQQHDQERSAQVAIMKDIFQNAEIILMWLGPDDNEHARDFTALIRLLSARISLEFNFTKFPSDRELRSMSLPSRNSSYWIAMKQFLTLPYFSRVWIVQEVVVASKAVAFWGSETYHWEELTAVLSWFGRNFGVVGSPLGSLQTGALGAVMFPGNYPLDLSLLLRLTHNHRSSDVRDRIFALLGLQAAPKNSVQSYKADYSKTFDVVRKEVTRYIINQEESLRILGDAQSTADELERDDCPSWALRINQPDSGIVFAKPFLSFTSFAAHRETSPYLGPSTQTALLSTKGLRIGRIKHHGQVLQRESDVGTITDSWELFQMSTRPTDPAAAIRTFVWTLAAGSQLTSTGPDDSPVRAIDTLLLDFAMLMSLSALEPDKTVTDPDDLNATGKNKAKMLSLDLLVLAIQTFRESHPEDDVQPKPTRPQAIDYIKQQLNAYYPNSNSKRYKEALAALTYMISSGLIKDEFASSLLFLQTLSQRIVFITQHNRLGLGPNTIRKGDIIVVFLGGPTPYVLRPVPELGQYRFLGECYLQDFMDGQAVDLMNEGVVDTEWFVLQ